MNCKKCGAPLPMCKCGKEESLPPTKNVKQFQREYEVEHNEEVYKVSCALSVLLDKNYGADADGNRGVERYSVINLHILYAYVVNEVGAEVAVFPLEPELECELYNLCGDLADAEDWSREW